jgi:lipopolysaccharide transport system ATP-binding protein
MKPILEIQHLSKKYKIQHLAGGYLSLREKLLGGFRSSKKIAEDFWALSDVSFDIQAGESIGIIGRNGAGKSTLLKILSKITPPTQGRIVTRGRVASLLEVGTGFHPELTGRENIFFNGSLLGMKRREIQEKFDEIIDFSGTEKFLDTPLKHYSSGMQLRLAFSVAAFLEPEILIIDEVLAVGDAEFQKKCLGKMEDVSKSGRTILFVSHNMISLKVLCSRGILLDRGSKRFDGNMDDAIRLYLSSGTKEKLNSRISDNALHTGTGVIRVKSIDITDDDDNKILHTGNTIQFKLFYEIIDNDFDFTSCHVGMLIYDQNQTVLVSHTNRLIGIQFKDQDFKNGGTIIFTIRDFPLNKGTYSLSYNIVDQNSYLDSMENAIEFEIEEGLIFNYQKPNSGGILAINGSWQISKLIKDEFH